MTFGVFVLAVVVVTQASPAAQYFKTGAAILEDVGQWRSPSRGEDSVDTIGISYFQGYVSGVVDGGSIKTPEGFTVDQACAIAAKFLRDNPQRLHEPAAALVKEAVRKAYPGR